MDELQPVIEIVKTRIADGGHMDSLQSELQQKGYSEEQIDFIFRDLDITKLPKGMSKRKQILWGSLFVFTFLIFATYASMREGNFREANISFGTDVSSIHETYEQVFREGEGGSNPIGHYRVRGNSVYYYQNCSDPFNTWCKHKLDGVSSKNFEPLSKDFARITANGETLIYQAQNDVTDKIADPTKFQALEKLESNPRYFSDGVYIYYLGTPRWEVGNDGIDDDSFPLKLSAGDFARVPDTFQENYLPSQKPEKILLLNNKVYLNGELIPDAVASSFERIESACLADRVGPWYKDAQRVYYNGHTLVNADPDTLTLHTYSNFNDQPRDADSCNTNVASDKSNVYYPTISFSANCDNGSLFCEIYEVVSGVSPQDIVVSTNRVVLDGRVVSGESFASTVTNNEGTFYLDGSRKTSEMKARVYLDKKWGKEYKGINARKGSYSVWYWIYSPKCEDLVKTEGDAWMTGSTEQNFKLVINDRIIDESSRCSGVFKASLGSGINSIELVSDNGEVLYQRNYEEADI